MSEVLQILPPLAWVENGFAEAMLGDQYMLYRVNDGEIQAATATVSWSSSSFSGDSDEFRTLEDVKNFYVSEADPERQRWRFKYLTEGETDALLRAG